MGNLFRIESKLKETLKPEYLKLIDDSADHSGHYEKNDDVEVSHLTVVIWSEKFKDLPTVRRHQLVNNILSDEFKLGLHALQIKIYNPNTDK